MLHYAEVNEANPLGIGTRIINPNSGVYITQSVIDTVEWSCWSYDTEEAAIAGSDGTAILEDQPLTVANVVFDTLQTPVWWRRDQAGFNFYAPIPSTAFPEPGWHRVEITFTPAAGEPWTLAIKVQVLPLQGE